jgi:hypothetical protein
MTGTTTFTPRVTINSSGLRVHAGMIIYSTQIEQDNAAGLTFNSSHGSGGIYFSIAGSERMRLDSSGNMSIGTSTSDALLYARRTSGTTAPIGRFEAAIGAFTGTSLTAQNTLGTSNTYNLFTCVTDSDGDSGGPYTLFQVRGDGRVGILGSSINQSALRVNGSISVTSSDTDFGAGGNRAMIDLAGSVARMGAMNGGGGAVELALYSASAERMRLDSSGNLLLGGSSSPASATRSFVIFNGTAPTGSVTNGVILYAEDVSTSSELKVRDEAGNITTLSPHNFSQIPEGPSEDMAFSYYSEKDNKYINVDMLAVVRELEKLSGKQFVYTGSKKRTRKTKRRMK